MKLDRPFFKSKTQAQSPQGHPVFKKGFLILGHRGAPYDAPENTLSGFRLAKNMGADGIELDIRLCRSGELVVIHDARVNRTTNGRGFVRSLSLAQLRHLSIRGNHLPSSVPEKIPTLREVFLEFAKNMTINVEIKGYPKRTDGVEERLLNLIHRFAASDRVIISSFNPIPLRRIRKLNANIATGFLIDRNFFVHRSEKAIQKMAGITAIHLEAALATPRFIERLKDLGLRCLIWGNVPEGKISTLLKLEIDGIITDHPDLVKKQLVRAHH